MEKGMLKRKLAVKIGSGTWSRKRK